jgi:hypothetical protein
MKYKILTKILFLIYLALKGEYLNHISDVRKYKAALGFYFACLVYRVQSSFLNLFDAKRGIFKPYK